MNDKTLLIDIDCAAQTKHVGLARGVYCDNRLTVTDACAMKYTRIDEAVCGWINDWGTASVLLALDSPLGWPSPMGPVLSDHKAGEPIRPTDACVLPNEVGVEARRFFSLETDQFIADHLEGITGHSKTPFDIGADKIARTAHATLCLLARLRRQLDLAIPLAWEPGTVEQVQSIEVYPAATLLVHERDAENLLVPGYKKRENRELREMMIQKIDRYFGSVGRGWDLFTDRAVRDAAEKTDDALDAVVCCLAAADFLTGNVVPPGPKQKALVEKEGWIWVASPPNAR